MEELVNWKIKQQKLPNLNSRKKIDLKKNEQSLRACETIIVQKGQG